MIHSYFVASALMTVSGLVVAFLLVRTRFFLLMAGVLAAPAGLADALFVPEYWSPEHLLSKNFSIEGLLFSFGNGVLIAALPTLVWPNLRPDRPDPLWSPLVRCAGPMIPGFLVFLLLWQHGLGTLMIMHAAFAGFAVIFVILGAFGWLSGRIILAGGLGFLTIYMLQVVLWTWLDPAVIAFWSADTYVFTLSVPPYLPIEELIWAFLYGALWASLMLFSFKVPIGDTAPVKMP